MFYLSTIILFLQFFTLVLSIKTASVGAINGIRDNLQLASITPSILPKFRPTGILTMSFGSIGVSLAKESVKFQPSLSYTPSRNHPIVQGSKMILVMMDVDASILHFVSPNLTLSSTSFKNGSFSLLTSAQQTSTSSSSPLSYLPPFPPPSSPTAHKYLLLLFNQPNTFSSNTMSTTPRNNFNLKRFMNQFNLGIPISATFFRVGGGENFSSSSGSDSSVGGSTTGEMVGKGLSNPVDDSGSGGGVSSSVKKSSTSSRKSTKVGTVGLLILSVVVAYLN